MKRWAVAIFALAITVACSSGASGGPQTTPPVAGASSISISTPNLSWILGGLPTPAPVIVADSRGIGTITVALSDPVHMGAAAMQPPPGSLSATVNVVPIGATTTPVTITVTDSIGDQGSFTASSAPCGRPDALNYAQLLFPQSGATKVPVSTPSIYVAGWTAAAVTLPPNSAPPGKIHLVVNKSSTIEGTTLSSATPPPNASTPAPVPGNFYVGSEPMPPLGPNATYDVYLYDDACESPFLAGTFST